MKVPESMGTSIKVVVEVKARKRWAKSSQPVFKSPVGGPGEEFAAAPFNWQSDVMATLFAGIRNYGQGITPIAMGRGLPADICAASLREVEDAWNSIDFDKPMSLPDSLQHMASCSWLSAAELLAVDYDVMISDRTNPSVQRPLREHLGSMYFTHLEQLKALGEPDCVRLLFLFTG